MFTTRDPTTKQSVELDRDAFGLLYRTHAGLVYRLCLRLLRDPVEAEDAAQDVFIRVFLKIHTFRGDSAFSSWLYRLTTNVALMRLRGNKLRNSSQLGENLEDLDYPAIDVAATDANLAILYRIDIQAAIDSLPRGYRTAFILHDIQGYRHNEIAGICGYSVGNSKSQVHKARRRLRQLLSDTRKKDAANILRAPIWARTTCASRCSR
jgi:RNA polymerase sigma-70 factor, ECF subfamily